jgi:hypothetical protein
MRCEECHLTARRYNYVSVTRRSIRAESWYFSRKVIPVRGEYGMSFCNPGTKLIVSNVSITCYRVVKRVGANCKNHDKLINYTVRVSKSVLFFHHYAGSIKKAESSLFFLISGQYPGSEKS